MVLISYVLTKMEKDKLVKLIKKHDCPPHRWIYKDNMNGGVYMICDICKVMPGEGRSYDPRGSGGYKD